MKLPGSAVSSALSHTLPPAQEAAVLYADGREAEAADLLVRSLRNGTPGVDPRELWYMLFEGLAWPVMNIFANLFFVWVALLYGMTKLLVLWWLLLTVLDLLIAVHAILMEGEDMRLALYSIFYRFFYILIIDVTKVFATLEELIGLDMSWGKLARKGRI